MPKIKSFQFRLKEDGLQKEAGCTYELTNKDQRGSFSRCPEIPEIFSVTNRKEMDINVLFKLNR